MIRRFKHRGLERFFTRRTPAGIQRAQVKEIRLILGWLHSAQSAQDMSLPGLYLHQLKGQRRDTWAVRVSVNWRITFRFEGDDAVDVDYEDYH